MPPRWLIVTVCVWLVLAVASILLLVLTVH
jgi:hypothetical protein